MPRPQTLFRIESENQQVLTIDDSSFQLFCTNHLGVSPAVVTKQIAQWIEEDAPSGDVTLWGARHVLDGQKNFTAHIIAKENIVLCGIYFVFKTFFEINKSIVFETSYNEGDKVKKGECICQITGPASALLLAERPALNLCARLTGIATYTAHIAQSLRAPGDAHQSAKNPKGAENETRVSLPVPELLETRKTTPGLRLFEKYATRTGGARNHRHGLDSGAMLKENHLRVLGGIRSACQTLTSQLPILTKLEIEVSSLEELKEALACKPDVIMLDNFKSLDAISQAVLLRNEICPEVKIELSGNLDENKIAFVRQAGVDYVSMGGLIHHASWSDLSMQIQTT